MAWFSAFAGGELWNHRRMGACLVRCGALPNASWFGATLRPHLPVLGNCERNGGASSSERFTTDGIRASDIRSRFGFCKPGRFELDRTTGRKGKNVTVQSRRGRAESLDRGRLLELAGGRHLRPVSETRVRRVPRLSRCSRSRPVQFTQLWIQVIRCSTMISPAGES